MPDPAPPARRRWILRLGLPLIALWLLAQGYDSRPLLADEPSRAAPVTSARAPFAVLELFTSEGCSSCPPADALLGEVAAQARQDERNVLCLAWHVDVWDYLGWRDPFGHPGHTLRQRDYARALRLRSTYTPQAVVNGEREFVGSRRSAARAALTAALAQPAPLGLEVERVRVASDEVRLRWRLDAAPPAGARVVACLLDPFRAQAVPRGENAGRTLEHTAVVRAFSDEPAQAQAGHLSLRPPPGYALERAEVAVLIQAGRGGRLLAAARAR